MTNKDRIYSALKAAGPVLLGVDGYVDEVWELVESRNQDNSITMCTHMGQFANRIMAAAGGGMSVEILRKRRTFGGFTANTGNAVAKLGVDTTMLSLYGKDMLDPVFEPFRENCEVISIGDSALTQIFEFNDGKVMLPYVEPIADFDWAFLVDALGLTRIKALLAKPAVIAIGYWSAMPAFDDVIKELCACLPADKQSRLFFDFADTRKRDEVSLVNTLALLKELHVPMTFSMNEHEAAQVFALYGKNITPKDMPELSMVEEVRQEMGLHEIVVHTPYYAVGASKDEGPAICPQVFTEKPVRTTGAGDTFNGAYISAIASKLPIQERLWFANAVVSFFLNKGYAPSLDEVLLTSYQ